MNPKKSYPVEWWLDRLENTKVVGDGYTALCPGHPDGENSLSVRPISGGTVVNCFSGCSFKEIIEGAEQFGPGAKSSSPKIVKKREKASKNPRGWWEEYTQVPSGFWEELGVEYHLGEIKFFWDEVPTTKSRPAGEKTFFWRPDGAPRPPIWPSLPDELPEEIWITEGESDCGILRYLGMPAWALTKGVLSLISLLDLIWPSLHRRGVERVIFVVDFDQAGEDALDKVIAGLFNAQIQVGYCDLGKVIQPLLGEKDIRDIWLRLADSDIFEKDLREAVYLFPTPTDEASRISIGALLSQTTQPIQWTVDQILLSNVVEMLVGAPKMMKSWLALDLGLSIATGTPFLNHFKTLDPGPVVYIGKEDPTYALKDRLSKILISKGLGGQASSLDSQVSVKFPSQKDIPLFVDLSRTFLFTPRELESLYIWLDQIKTEYGHIKMVVFDPILRMMTGVDEYKATDVNLKLFEPVTRIAEETGASVMMVHHRSKQAQGAKGSYGSVAFHAFADGTMYLMGTQPDKQGWVDVLSEFKSAREHEWSYRLSLESETYNSQVHIGTRSTGADKDNPILDELLLFLDNNPQPVIRIQKKFSEVPLTMLRGLLKDLEDQGLLSREKETKKQKGAKGGPRRDLWVSVKIEGEPASP